MTAVLIRDVLIVPHDEVPFHGWITVENDQIAAIGRGHRDAQAGQSVIEGHGGALLPGFVNTHAHSHSSLTRGSAEGLPLEGWIRVIEREQSQLTDEQAYIGALATYAEAMLSGTTSIVDMCIRPEPALAAARDIGIRATIVPYVADTKPFAPTLEQNARLLELNDDSDGRVRVWVGLHDLESCSDEAVRAGAELARTHRTGLHLHCSETHFSVERTRARVGRTPIAHLAELDALDAHTLLAHCVWASEEDRALIGVGRRPRGALPACQSQARFRRRAGPGHAPARHQRHAGDRRREGQQPPRYVRRDEVCLAAAQGRWARSHDLAAGRNLRDGHPTRSGSTRSADRRRVARPQGRFGARTTR